MFQVSKGQLFVQEYFESEQYTFLDYIANGYELNFMVAIDFTGKYNFSEWNSCARDDLNSSFGF